MISFDLQKIAFEYLFDLKDQMNMYHLTREHEMNLKITDLYDIPEKYLHKIDQNLIKQDKYRTLKRLNLAGNRKITDVNHLLDLEELDCSYIDCAIKQDGIKRIVKFKKLNIHDNFGITDLNHLTELVELNCSGDYYEIKQDGIKSIVNLEVLIAWDCSGINNVNHLKKLKYLDCSYNSYINQNGIKNITNLEKNE